MRCLRFINSLIVVLLLSASAPCGLFEVEADPVCTTTAAADNAAEDEHADDLHLDCCAGCLTCCASYTASPSGRLLLPPAALTASPPMPDTGPRACIPSIWRPPRS